MNLNSLWNVNDVRRMKRWSKIPKYDISFLARRHKDRDQRCVLYHHHHHHHRLKGTARQKMGKRFGGCKSDDRAVRPAPKHLAECQHSYLALENHFSLCFAWCLVFSKKLRFAILLNKNFFSSILLEAGKRSYEFCFYTTSRQSVSRYYLLCVPCGGSDIPANFQYELPVSKKNGLPICYTYL